MVKCIVAAISFHLTYCLQQKVEHRRWEIQPVILTVLQTSIRSNCVAGNGGQSDVESCLQLVFLFFFRREVLNLSKGIEEVGLIKWDLALCLLFSWMVVILCLVKGIKTSGKVSLRTINQSKQCPTANEMKNTPSFLHNHD